MDLAKSVEKLQGAFNSVDAFIDELYATHFSMYFEQEERLYTRFRAITVPITDDELEEIITSLPLNLYKASSALAQFQAHNELSKLSIKQLKQLDIPQDSDSISLEEYQVMSVVYNTVITRVERQISFSKELIMGAKKVWDARRRTEQVPIKETNSDLPDYAFTNTYIKGV